MASQYQDFSDLLDLYGEEYLQEYYPDDMLYPMDEVSEVITDVWEALRSSFYGYDYNPYREDEHREQFNPNRDYFGFNGYGNLVSIDGSYRRDWLARMVDMDEFTNWCIERGYIDEDEDEEDEEYIEGLRGISGFEVTELSPRYDRAQSFYGKALVVEYPGDPNTLHLLSYRTDVAEWNKRSETLTVKGYYSNTTARHIREFARQLGIELPKGTNIEGKYKA